MTDPECRAHWSSARESLVKRNAQNLCCGAFPNPKTAQTFAGNALAKSNR